LPETDATKTTSKQDAIVSLLESKDKSPETLIDSISRLKNLSAITPLPAAKDAVQVEGNKPLEQIASLQKALAGVKPEADKPAVKADSLAGQNNAIPNTITPQAVGQVQQQNLSQQFGQKKQGAENIEALKAGGEKIDVSELLAQQASSQKLDAAKLPSHDFAQHLNKAAIASPSEQIAMQIAKLPSGKQNITVQLDPADLGRVDVKLEIGNDGRTHISIMAERKETLDMLKNDMGSLQRSLADSGIKADAGTMQFNLKNQEGFASQLNQGDGQKNNGQTAQQTADAELKQTIESASLAARYVNLNNLLDLKV
jgi:flagellar hook-length control protein FliK